MNISVRLLKYCLFVSILVALQPSVLPSTVINEAYDRLQAAERCNILCVPVRTITLEYAAPVWSPHLHKDIIIDTWKDTTVCKQNVHKTWDCSDNEPLDRLQLPTLAQHRLHLSLCFMYRIIHGLMYFPPNIIVPSSTPSHYTRSYSFAPTICMHWLLLVFFLT